jgi:hypothetical protein
VNLCPAWPQRLDFFGTTLVIEPSSGQFSSDAGSLPIRQFDERIGLTQAFAAALDDPRNPNLTEHTFLEMVRSRIYGILAGYVDQNDHDTLCHDPVFKLGVSTGPIRAGLPWRTGCMHLGGRLAAKALNNPGYSTGDASAAMAPMSL